MKVDPLDILFVFILVGTLGLAYYYDAHHKRTDNVKVFENCKCENLK